MYVLLRLLMLRAIGRNVCAVMLVVLVLLRNLRSVDCGIIWMYSSRLLLAWTSSLRIWIRLG